MKKLLLLPVFIFSLVLNAKAEVREMNRHTEIRTLNPQERMYAFIGMNYIFYRKEFIEYAKLNYAVPVIMKNWKTSPAIVEFKKRFDPNYPYSFYGYSWGVQPARDLILYHKYRPERFIAVGPYYKVTRMNLIDKTGVRVLIYGDASSGPTFKVYKNEKGRPISHDKIMEHVLYLEELKRKK